MIRALYSLCLWLATPWLLLHLVLRSRKQPEYRLHWRERFGMYRQVPVVRRFIWIHAVSVGETRAAQTLVARLRQRNPEYAILMTHMTPTGRATSEQLFGDQIIRLYLPYDFPFAVRSFVRHFRPALGILMETEVWPNLVAECASANVPLLLANARLSKKSFEKAERFDALIRPALQSLSGVFAQSQTDAERLCKAGAHDVEVIGNLKFDIEPPRDQLELGRFFRSLFGSRPVLLAASTREGEEILLLDAFAETRLPEHTLLAIVPRHPQRFDEVAQLLEARKIVYQRRSKRSSDSHSDNASFAPVPHETQVWLGDSMGELFAYYAAADLAFIGGSLVPLGGQNLIEACAVGCPVLIGPHTFNFAQVTEDAVAAGAAVRVADAAAVFVEAARLLLDSAARTAMAANAAGFSAAHQGATERTLAALARFLKVD